MADKPESANTALFEDDYVLRTLGRIGHEPDVALAELVANAWDAGAAKVSVVIPEETGGTLVVEDDGSGMTAEHFRARWMKLGYDRLKGQGARVVFPPERSEQRRMAFGRNGRGRHGLLCFSDEYTVSTWCDGECHEFLVATRNRADSPFYIREELSKRMNGHGTRLRVVVDRHLPKVSEVRQVLAARFLHDPQFTVEVNGESVPLHQHEGLIETEHLDIEPGFAVVANVVDATQTAPATRYQGVAFWVSNRLVGMPSWLVGSAMAVDGRSRFAKRYAIIVQAGAEWGEDIEPDWSAFKRNERTGRLFERVRRYAKSVEEKLSSGMADEQSREALYRNREALRGLPVGAQVETVRFAQEFLHEQPSVGAETLQKAVRAVIRIHEARGGAGLLEQLVQLRDDDVEGLSRLLATWSVQDALTVLDEIDRRLSVVAALEKLSADADVDELHILHPLTTQSRWLFGPEFDSAEYASNNTLRSVALRLFGADPNQTKFYNPAKRPDLVVLADATLSLYGTQKFEGDEPRLVGVRDVLLIELKRGASVIGAKEMAQTLGYVQQLITSGGIDGEPAFHAFTVGHRVGHDVITPQKLGERHTVRATTYNQLTLTANRRLLDLKARIPQRYEELSGYDLLKRVMDVPSQAEWNERDGFDEATAASS